MDTIQTDTPTTDPVIVPPAPLPPLERLEHLVERLAADALALRQPGSYSIAVDLCVDMEGAISIDPSLGLGVTKYQRTIDIPTVGAEPHDGDLAWASAAIERELLAEGPDSSPSILALAARLHGSADLVELAHVRQLDVDSTRCDAWEVSGVGRVGRVGIAATGRANDLRGVAGARLIAAYAWSALGYPAYAVIHVVPAMGSTLPVVRFGVHDHMLDASADCAAWWSPVTAFRPLTRRDSLVALPADSDPIAQEIHLARTTGDRAESRRRAAAAALCQYVLDETWGADRSDIVAWVRREDSAYPDLRSADLPVPLTDEQRRALGVIAALEVHGIGGPGGYTGDATARMSWAIGLGKGRRQASDGAAWSSAIGALADAAPSPEAVTAALPYIRHADLEWPMAYALGQVQATMAIDAQWARAWCDVARAVYARATAEDAPHTDGGAVALGRRYGVDRCGS
jgi:hypothetical protein